MITSRGELKLVALKDDRIRQLLIQIEALQDSLRKAPREIARSCAEIATKHECRTTAEEIRRRFGVHD